VTGEIWDQLMNSSTDRAEDSGLLPAAGAGLNIGQLLLRPSAIPDGESCHLSAAVGKY
jgi:hypothetical protein